MNRPKVQVGNFFEKYIFIFTEEKDYFIISPHYDQDSKLIIIIYKRTEDGWRWYFQKEFEIPYDEDKEIKKLEKLLVEEAERRVIYE